MRLFNLKQRDSRMYQLKSLLFYSTSYILAGLISVVMFLAIFGVFSFLVGCNGNLTKDVHDLQTSQDAQDQRLNALDSQLGSLELMLDNVASESDIDVSVVQTQVNLVKVQIATLQGYKNIVSIIDPCGDAAGIHDEVLLRLQDNSILASFSDSASGSNTRFSIIGLGSYVTTDGSNCHFTVASSGAVTY